MKALKVRMEPVLEKINHTLNKTERNLLLGLMARIMESAYRRGVHQALFLKETKGIDEWIINSPHAYRYGRSLEMSIGLDGYITTSRERLLIEEDLHMFLNLDTEEEK